MQVARSALSVVLVGGVAAAVDASVFDEQVNGGADAGGTIGTATVVPGGTTRIEGYMRGANGRPAANGPTNPGYEMTSNLEAVPNYVDVYRIEIENPSTFSARLTVTEQNADADLELGGGGGFGTPSFADPNFFMVDAQGRPVAASFDTGGLFTGDFGVFQPDYDLGGYLVNHDTPRTSRMEGMQGIGAGNSTIVDSGVYYLAVVQGQNGGFAPGPDAPTDGFLWNRPRPENNFLGQTGADRLWTGFGDIWGSWGPTDEFAQVSGDFVEGVSNWQADFNYAIDFIQIPAPGAAALLGLAGFAGLRRR
jgi:hypothetical protein